MLCQHVLNTSYRELSHILRWPVISYTLFAASPDSGHRRLMVKAVRKWRQDLRR